MKFRLVQDSYTKKFSIEAWESTPDVHGFDSDLTPMLYKNCGYWIGLYGSHSFLYSDFKAHFEADEEKLARATFARLIETIKSKKIVVEEFEG